MTVSLSSFSNRLLNVFGLEISQIESSGFTEELPQQISLGYSSLIPRIDGCA
jgi:hypothetical protein